MPDRRREALACPPGQVKRVAALRMVGPVPTRTLALREVGTFVSTPARFDLPDRVDRLGT